MTCIAPWTDAEVASLNDYQACEVFHPYTGENSATKLIATPAGWIEHEGGEVVQSWAHPFTADGSWRDMAEQTRRLIVKFD